MTDCIDPHGTLYSWFRDTARRTPHLSALEVTGTRLSYAELLALTGRLAAALTGADTRWPRAVGLCARRSVAAYAGYLAALRAGAIVVPLNPDAPVARNRAICQLAHVDAVILDDAGAAQAAPLQEALRKRPSVLLLRAEADWQAQLPAAGGEDEQPGRPDDLAYILFTSGSTGQPKGVPIRHRQLTDYLAHCIERYGVGPDSRLSQTFDLTFDPSVFDMFVAWGSGGTLVVPQPDELLTPARFVADRQITHWFSVPSVISLAERLRSLRPGSMPTLRWSLFAGEQLTLAQARAWAVAAPCSTLENLYGPTELTVTCTGHRLPARQEHWPQTANGTVPIGQPYPHLEAVVLDEHGHEAGEGELCVRGSQRFDGYLDRRDDEGRYCQYTGPGPAITAQGARETTHWYRTGDRVRREDSGLVHLGRVDEQVKLHGHRVELGEVEHVLRQHPEVTDAAVLCLDAQEGPPQLSALYSGPPDSEQALREHVRSLLPSYMVPARLVCVPQFPLNANGKVDRKRLRHLATTEAETL